MVVNGSLEGDLNKEGYSNNKKNKKVKANKRFLHYFFVSLLLSTICTKEGLVFVCF